MRFLALATAVLAYFGTVAWLHPRALSFDALANLMAQRAGTIDYGHALYLPLLRAAHGAAGGSLAPERSAQLVSAVGAALAFALLWLRAQREGASAGRAGLVAACFGLGTLLWQEAGSVEPTTWTVASLLAAAEASEAYGRRPTLARLALAAGAFGSALGFHLVSVCALPWLIVRAWGGRGSVPRAHVLLLIGAALLVLGLAWLGGELGTYGRYWSGFVPRYEDGMGAALARHGARGGRLVVEGAPVLLAGAALAAIVLARRGAALLAESLVLAGPYLLAFLAFGKPLVGLLVPVLLASALLLARAAGSVALPARVSLARSSAVGALFALGAGLEAAHSLPQALAWRRGPDELHVRAERFARHVPEGALVFAGPLANHFRYYWPALEVVALPELWHQAFTRDRGADPITVVQQAVEASGRPCVLTSEGAGFLTGGLGADVARLGLRLERALFLPEDPSLALFPLGDVESRGPAEAR